MQATIVIESPTQCSAKCHCEKVSGMFVILTQSSVSPALGVAGCMDQKHAGLMGHPRTEKKQQRA